MDYAGPGRRILASLIDLLCEVPLAALIYLIGSRGPWQEAVMQLPLLLFYVWLNVWMTLRYGGSPGKLLLRMRVVMADGSPVTRTAAWRRYAVWLGLVALGSALYVAALLGADPADYRPLGWFQRAEGVDLPQPVSDITDWITLAWVVGCLMTLTADRRHRALHDFIAGTVVVRRPASAGAVPKDQNV